VSKSWNGYAAIVYPGLIGESARWGDLHVSRPEVREGNWQLATGNWQLATPARSRKRNVDSAANGNHCVTGSGNC
jgi:hypothetical protein